MGKSTFLERDLIPAAKQAGYLTPYLNLWTATHTPSQALVRVVSWAPLTPFPLLGEAFETLGRTPEFFRLYLSRYLAYASEGSAAALAHTRAEVYNDTTLQRTWQSLPPLDRAVLQLIARGVTSG